MLQSYDRVTQAVTGCELVFHQAALPSVSRSVQDPLSTNATNVAGTLNVLLAARDHDVRRVICASSSSVYGASNELPKREDGPTLPLSPYATTKLALEGYARFMHAVHGLDTVALRYFNVFGPRQNPRSQYATVVPNFVSALIAGRAPVIFGNGKQSRDFTYVADAVTANILAIDAPEAPGRVYNVGCGERVSINQLLAELCLLLGFEDVEPIHRRPRPADMEHTLADLSRARARRTQPSVRLREGLERTIHHILEQEPRAALSPISLTADSWAVAGDGHDRASLQA